MSHRLNATQLTVQYNGRNRMPDELGAVAWDSHGRKFRFVKSASVNTAGDVLGITSTATTAGAQGRGWRASRTASARNSRGAVGVAIAALSSSMYGWVQCAGPLGTFGTLTTKMKTDKSVVAGDDVIKDQTTAAMGDTAVATGSQSGMIVGYALGSDSGSFLVAGTLIDRFAT